MLGIYVDPRVAADDPQGTNKRGLSPDPGISDTL
jgi:hypothetical protein